MAVLIALPKHDYLKRSLTLKKPRNPLLKRILGSLFTVIQTRCRNSNLKQFCLDNIVPDILIILISHNYHSYTMGAYQNLISSDKRL